MSGSSYRRHVILDAEVAEKHSQSAIGNDEYWITIVDGRVFNVQHHYEQKSPDPNSHMWTSDVIREPDLPQPVVDAFQAQLSACNVTVSGGGNRPNTPDVVNTRVSVRIRDSGSTYEFEKRPADYVEVRESGNEIRPKDVPKNVRDEAESILDGNVTYLYDFLNP